MYKGYMTQTNKTEYQSLSCFLSVAAFAAGIWGAEGSDAGLEKSQWYDNGDI